jgi:hypothetical protein
MYNVAVGVAGAMSAASLMVAKLIVDPEHFEFVPWQAVLAYALIANVAYSAGPVVDSYICRRWGAQYVSIGPALFRYGFVFAVGVTLIPIPVAVVAVIANALSAFF